MRKGVGIDYKVLDKIESGFFKKEKTKEGCKNNGNDFGKSF